MQMTGCLVSLRGCVLCHAKLMHVTLRVFTAVLVGMIGVCRSIEYHCALGLSARGMRMSIDDKDDEIKKICAKGYLDYIYRLNTRIKDVFASIETERSRLGIMGVSYDGIQSKGCNRDGLPNAVIAMIEIIDKVEADVAEYKEQIEIARSVILGIEEDAAYRVVMRHYFDGVAWIDVAHEFNYSIRSIYYMRDRALVEIYPLMPEQWRSSLPKAI